MLISDIDACDVYSDIRVGMRRVAFIVGGATFGGAALATGWWLRDQLDRYVSYADSPMASLSYVRHMSCLYTYDLIGNVCCDGVGEVNISA